MTDSKIRLDFMVLGAQKAGTTSLHEMLMKHPELSLPTIKETHFFSHKQSADWGRKWYDAQFAPKSPARLKGEVDPDYLYVPQAAANILAWAKVEKFIVVLRHPLERAYSHYQMSVRRGYEPLEFSEALEKERERLEGGPLVFAQDHWSYTDRSLYYGQISRFLQTFPKAAFLFLRSDGLDGEGYLRVCEFLQLDPAAENWEGAPRSNAASAPRSKIIRDFLYAPRGKSSIRRWIVRVIPRSVKRAVFLLLDRINQKPVTQDKSALSSKLPKEILKAMLEDLRCTETLTGLDLSDWINDLEVRIQQR